MTRREKAMPTTSSTYKLFWSSPMWSFTFLRSSNRFLWREVIRKRREIEPPKRSSVTSWMLTMANWCRPTCRSRTLKRRVRRFGPFQRAPTINMTQTRSLIWPRKFQCRCHTMRTSSALCHSPKTPSMLRPFRKAHSPLIWMALIQPANLSSMMASPHQTRHISLTAVSCPWSCTIMGRGIWWDWTRMSALGCGPSTWRAQASPCKKMKKTKAIGKSLPSAVSRDNSSHLAQM